MVSVSCDVSASIIKSVIDYKTLETTLFLFQLSISNQYAVLFNTISNTIILISIKMATIINVLAYLKHYFHQNDLILYKYRINIFSFSLNQSKINFML